MHDLLLRHVRLVDLDGAAAPATGGPPTDPVDVLVRDGVVADVAIALGGVAHKPWRATRAEAALRGGPATDEAFRAAARAELADAVPVESDLGGNAFKLPLVSGTLTATLRTLAKETP